MSEVGKERKTVGAHSAELLSSPDLRQGVIDTQREMQKGYYDMVKDCVARYPDWKDPFYVVVRNKREIHMPNVIRQQIWARQTRPMPDYDLTLWKYTPATGDLEWEWVIPDQFTCSFLVDNESVLPDEQKSLISMVKKFKAGLLV